METIIQKKKPGSQIRRRLLRSGILCILIIILFTLKSSPDFVELHFSRRLFPVVRSCLQFLFNPIPFSIGDLCYIILIVILLWRLSLIVIHFFRKSIRVAVMAMLNLFIFLQLLILIFYCFWALNYFRISATERYGLSDRDYTEIELQNTARLIIDSMNTLRAELSREELQQSFPSVAKDAELSFRQLPPEFRSKDSNPKVKASLLSGIMSYMGAAGYFNPFTSEAQVNTKIPIYSSAFIACHELAHQLGSGAEDEASFVGYIAAINSNSKLLKYSAYYNASQEFMQAVWLSDSVLYKQLKQKISPAVMNDLVQEREFWLKYQGKANQLSSLFYDIYLKANKQPQGIKTYNQMVRLTIAYYRKRVMPSTLNYISRLPRQE